jgi:hypothetical protein
MKNIKKIVLNSAAITIAALVVSGCSAIQEGLASQVEVPTLEKQANRVAVGMAIVKENNILENKLAFSSDAKWPILVTQDRDDNETKILNMALMNDPYYSTVHYTKAIQRQMLGSGQLMNSLGSYGNVIGSLADQTVSPLEYLAFHKLNILFANPALKKPEQYATQEEFIKAKTKYWPDIFKYNTDISKILEFEKGKIIEIEAATGDVYPNIHKAVLALAPVNLSKDLESGQLDYLDSIEKVAKLEGKLGEIKNQLDSGKDSSGEIMLSEEQKATLNEELAVLEEQLKEANSISDEKEAVYFELLSQMSVALESEINIDDENYVKLARNINLIATELQDSATQAYTLFGIATTQLLGNNALANFPKELESLAVAKASIPLNLQDKYNERMQRLVINALVILPNMGMGIYYAHKQSIIGEKYENITNMILEAYNLKKEQEKQAKEDMAKVEADASK